MATITEEKAFVADGYGAKAGGSWNPGYVFTGWNTSPDGTGTAVAGGQSWMPDADLTLYAQWRRDVQRVTVYVYTWNKAAAAGSQEYDWTAVVKDPGGVAHTTNAAVNVFDFSSGDALGEITVTAPTLMIQPGEGETLTAVEGGRDVGYTQGNAYVAQAAEPTSRTVRFRPGGFSELHIYKLPVGQTLQVNGVYHMRTPNYGDAGTVFGGHRYVVRWYDDYRFVFKTSGQTVYTDQTVPEDYTYDPGSLSGFVNIAHKGGVTSHDMHAWLGYAFDCGKKASGYDRSFQYQ